jgi:hypothetical protein
MRGVADTLYGAGIAWSDLLYRTTFGQPPPDQVKQIADDTYSGIIQAGGTQQAAQSAADQAANVANAGGPSNTAIWLLAAAAVGAIALIDLL